MSCYAVCPRPCPLRYRPLMMMEPHTPVAINIFTQLRQRRRRGVCLCWDLGSWCRPGSMLLLSCVWVCVQRLKRFSSMLFSLFFHFSSVWLCSPVVFWTFCSNTPHMQCMACEWQLEGTMNVERTPGCCPRSPRACA